MSAFISPDALRAQFAASMSSLFKAEVPLYGELIALVDATNEPLLGPLSPEERGRLSAERHGAIRVGTPTELRTLSRLFGLLGMTAVGYYDLSVAGHPVHATAFRSVSEDSLIKNPFRVFCSLLRLDLIPDEEIRKQAMDTLSKRSIFTPRTLAFLDSAERDGGIEEQDAHEFVREALKTFQWHAMASVSQQMYEKLLGVSRLLADICSFPGPHINRNKVRIVRTDQIPPKSIIEGPPPRLCPILLRQTSFKALEERILFIDDEHRTTLGHHTARFGEVESRGAALTLKGRELFNRLFEQARETEVEVAGGSHIELRDDGEPGRKTPEEESANAVHQRHLASFFEEFPDDWEELRKQELVYFRYELVEAGQEPEVAEFTMDELIASGKVLAKPIVYEDFLPASAAGIFNSNLKSGESTISEGNPDQTAFEVALGSKVEDADRLYRERQSASVDQLRRGFPNLKLGK
ncbi:2-oxoadipate dioxygenase/decarboxylase, partial [Phenoliferia sp. Uapishka_3]